MRSHETKLIFDCAFSLAIYIQVYIYVHMYAFSHAHMYTHIQTYVSLTSIIWVSVGLHVWVTYIWTNKSIHLHIYSLYVNYFIDTSKYFVTTLGLHRVYVGVPDLSISWQSLNAVKEKLIFGNTELATVCGLLVTVEHTVWIHVLSGSNITYRSCVLGHWCTRSSRIIYVHADVH